MSEKRHKIRKDRLIPMLMALPFFVLIFLMNYVPIIGWLLAFTNYRPGKAWEKVEFVGLKYFKLIGYYWEDIAQALRNTLVLSALSLLTMILPLIFALLLNEIRKKRFKKIVQSLVTLPHFVSWVIVYSLIFALFSTDGLINNLLADFGSDTRVNVLMNSGFSWIFMTLLTIWKNLGWDSIIYLAALAGADMELYEAAYVDGAGRWACARYISLPSLMPTFFVLLILRIGNILSIGMEQYLLFQNPFTMETLEVLDTLVYRIGITTNDYPLGAAVSILKSIVSICLLSFANFFSKKVRGEGVL